MSSPAKYWTFPSISKSLPTALAFLCLLKPIGNAQSNSTLALGAAVTTLESASDRREIVDWNFILAETFWT